MRLYTPFVRLPLRVDAGALANEVAALSAELWRPHPEGAPGNTAVALVARDGNPENDVAKGPMLPTPVLEEMPYTRQVLAALGSVVGRTRLMRIEEEGELTAHLDTNYYWRDHLRVHFPVVTTPDVTFECDHETVHMESGEAWVFDTWRPHRVVNPSGAARVHLVVDTVGSAALWDMIESPDQPAHDVPFVRDADVDLVTERINHPIVMTPWEFQLALDALVGELATIDADRADDLAQTLRPFRHAWRETWARFGPAPEGWDAFVALRNRADAAVAQVAGDARLPNGAPVVEAVRQHVLRSAVDPDRGNPAPGDPRFRPTLAPRPEPVSIDRPVFVVSSPRSGSSMLFEALARAPGLFTIGGESHLVIEGVRGLHPRDRGWDSNRLDASDARPEFVDALRRGFIAELHDRDGMRPTSGLVRMLEKTPKNSLRVPFLATAFPDARFVYLYRDPRETVSSMYDAWQSGRFRTYPDLPGWPDPPWSLLLVPGWRELAGRPLGEIVTTQWATATELLLDDLEALDPERWCVSSYDQIVADPQAEMERLCAFCDLEWDVELTHDLPLSRHTLDSPHPDKWRRNADVLEPSWDRVREVAVHARDVFAAPPRIKPVKPRATRPPEPSLPPSPKQQEAAAQPDEPASFGSVHSSGFPELLDSLGCSLVVSTYQSGRLIVVRSHEGALNTHFRAFPSPMGIARHGMWLALGTKAEVHVFQNQPAVSSRLDPPNLHDAVFMPRRVHATGDIRIHDLGYAGEELWAVNTRFSCLVTFDDAHSFVPRWRPPFVTALSADDRCHLNGLGIIDGEPKYVTALGMSDEAGGWREHKAKGGVVLDVPSGEPIVTGLCMPHSPRWHDGRLWLLESGRGVLGVVDLETGTVEDVAAVPGFARGLGFAGPLAFVGLSQVRENLFDGLPLTEEGVERTSGVWVVDTRSGQIAAFLRFEGIVQEIFEVAVLEGVRFPEITEPGSELASTSFVLPDVALADVAGAEPRPAPNELGSGREGDV